MDDFTCTVRNIEQAKYLREWSKKWLWDNLHVTLHPDKTYIQDVTKGVGMVGSIVKPGRIYLNNRTVGNFWNCLHELEWACVMSDRDAILHNIIRINSLLGFMRHHATYAFRSSWFRKVNVFWRYCWIKGRFEVVKPKKKKLGLCL